MLSMCLSQNTVFVLELTNTGIGYVPNTNQIVRNGFAPVLQDSEERRLPS